MLVILYSGQSHKSIFMIQRKSKNIFYNVKQFFHILGYIY